MATFMRHFNRFSVIERRTVLFLCGATAFLVVMLAIFVSGAGANGAQPASAKALSQSTLATIDRLQMRLRRNPDDAAAYAGLGLSFLQLVRETGDTTQYGRARQALDAALAREPQQLDALTGRGILALALHDFRGALGWGEQVLAQDSYRPAGYGILVDGQVELGQYAAAVATAQQMVDLRPDLESYTRVAYLRELHGDVPGALAAMTMALKTTAPGSEPWLWTQAQIGHLHWSVGDLAAAEGAYRNCLALRADYPYAKAGLARVQAAQGDIRGAIRLMEPVAAKLPLAEFLLLLGDLHQTAGDVKGAEAQYDLVQLTQQLNAAAGMAVDLELASFAVRHDADAAQALVQAQTAFALRPTIYAADTLAWAWYRTGDLAQAQRLSRKALRLGTRDAGFHYHAGMIALAAGNSTGARLHLQQALALNPHFSVLDAPLAVRALIDIE